jgi:hypothetical protein
VNRVCVLALLGLSAFGGACFTDVGELRDLPTTGTETGTGGDPLGSGGESAGGDSAGGESQGSSGSTVSAGGAGPFPLCGDPNGECAAPCPIGSTCENGCCEIVSAPPYCGTGWDVTAGAVFHGTTCSGTPTQDIQCANPVPEDGGPMLFFHVGTSPAGGGAYEVRIDDPLARVGLTCGEQDKCESASGGNVENPIFTILNDTTFFVQVVAPCELLPLRIEIIPK